MKGQPKSNPDIAAAHDDRAREIRRIMAELAGRGFYVMGALLPDETRRPWPKPVKRPN